MSRNGKAPTQRVPSPGRVQRGKELAKLRPPQPNKRHLLHGAVPAEAQEAAEAALFSAHIHLRPDRDGPLVASLASLDLIINRAWEWFLRVGRIAEATASGKVQWAPGLDMLLRLEERRLRLAEALLVTPASRRAAKLPLTPEEGAIDLDAIKARYAQKPEGEVG